MLEAMPEPESDDLGRYLEDTITIDWQTPRVAETARSLIEGVPDCADRVRALFAFVRDEIPHSQDIETTETPCSASAVIARVPSGRFAR